jgi:methionyl-tRNA formyltransferase
MGISVSKPIRIVLFGDGAWATNSLLRLAKTPHSIVGVVARKEPSDPTFAETVRALGLPLMQPSNPNSIEFADRVKSLAPDLNLSISYNQILRRSIIETASLGFLNFHAGKLPYYRGRNVINWAIINGEREIGMTAHFVDEGIDTGDIVLQRTLPIEWTDTYGDVLSRVVDAFPDLVLEAVAMIASGQPKRIQQADHPGTYFPGREEGDEWLDWSDNSFNLHNKIRAITRPGPGARTLLGNKIVRVWRAFYDPSWPKYMATPGQIVGRRDNGVLVKTGDSTIMLQEIQIDNDTCETPSWRIGTRLGINLVALLPNILDRLATSK